MQELLKLFAMLMWEIWEMVKLLLKLMVKYNVVTDAVSSAVEVDYGKANENTYCYNFCFQFMLIV